jgi:hypothetical protein
VRRGIQILVFDRSQGMGELLLRILAAVGIIFASTCRLPRSARCSP